MTPLLAEIRSKPRPPLPALAKATREAAGVSQERLAEELHVHRVTVARWEAGVRTPRDKLLADYVELLAELREVTPT